MLKYLEHVVSETEKQLGCNEYCLAKREKMKSSLVHYLVNKTNIYESFKPRPKCSGTTISEVNSTYDRLMAPDPMGFITKSD